MLPESGRVLGIGYQKMNRGIYYVTSIMYMAPSEPQAVWERVPAILVLQDYGDFTYHPQNLLIVADGYSFDPNALNIVRMNFIGSFESPYLEDSNTYRVFTVDFPAPLTEDKRIAAIQNEN
jgi:hypothetical protein